LQPIGRLSVSGRSSCQKISGSEEERIGHVGSPEFGRYLADTVALELRANGGCLYAFAVKLSDCYSAGVDVQEVAKAIWHFTHQMLRKAGFFQTRESERVIPDMTIILPDKLGRMSQSWEVTGVVLLPYSPPFPVNQLSNI
jgi:hypothetical protein